MHPLFGRVSRLAAYVTAWVLAAAMLASVMTRLGPGWFEAFAFLAPLFVLYSFICLSAWYVCRAQPVQGLTLPRLIGSSASAALVAAALWLAMGRATLMVLGTTDTFEGAAARLGPQLPLIFVLGILLYLLSIAVHYALLAIDAAREAERHQLELELLARDAELRALRAQINPHFLYNSLNSISALTMRDPAGARRMCVLLGDFLRSTLNVSNHERIALSEELALVDRFLDIEQVRFGSRLQVERAIDAAALDCAVPPLVLQPLVENAIVHGIASRLEGGVIRLAVSRQDDRVLMSVDNPRDADSPAVVRTGVGLDNVQRRLTTMFDHRAALRVTAEPERFRVDLTIPWTPR